MADLATNGNLNDMGFGLLGSNDIVFKRKYRWMFSIFTDCQGAIPPQFVKLASRPNLTIEETEINFLHGKMWIPGKGSWETITITYYDLGGASVAAGMTALYSWLATVYNFTNAGFRQGVTRLSQSSKRGTPAFGLPTGQGGYAGTGVLDLYDGCGTSMETWMMGNMWPQAINFGELDYSSSEEVTMELTLRYSEVQWQSNCGGQVVPCCTGC
jgi:hypothetical protein